MSKLGPPELVALVSAIIMVITFLPYSDFTASVHSLDKARLGKQRGEVLMILNALTDSEHRYHNHIQVRMWQGCKDALVCYGVAVCDEWIARGYKDTTREKILVFLTPGVHCNQEWLTRQGIMPSWLGDERVHASHRGRLIQKDWAYYQAKLGWRDKPCAEYFWPEVPSESTRTASSGTPRP